MKYDIHIYPIVRVKVSGIEADSPQEAMMKAEEMIDLYSLVREGKAEYAEDIDCFLVDEVEGGEVKGSKWYDKEYEPL